VRLTVCFLEEKVTVEQVYWQHQLNVGDQEGKLQIQSSMFKLVMQDFNVLVVNIVFSVKGLVLNDNLDFHFR
jgi:hypothetical protein